MALSHSQPAYCREPEGLSCIAAASLSLFPLTWRHLAGVKSGQVKRFILSGVTNGRSEYRPDSVTHILQKVILPSLGTYLTGGYQIHLAVYNYAASNKENKLLEKHTPLSQLNMLIKSLASKTLCISLKLLSNLFCPTQFEVFSF